MCFYFLIDCRLVVRKNSVDKIFCFSFLFGLPYGFICNLRPVPWGGTPYVLLQLRTVWSRSIWFCLEKLSFMAWLSILSFVQIFFSRTCHPVWCRPDGYELIWEDVGLLEGDVLFYHIIISTCISYHICDHDMPCSYWSFFLYVDTQMLYSVGEQ
jgi:hypothetical protein